MTGRRGFPTLTNVRSERVVYARRAASLTTGALKVSAGAISEEKELGLRVVARRDMAEGVIAVEVGKPDGSCLPAWEPGAHIDVELATGLTRQNSLCWRTAAALALQYPFSMSWQRTATGFGRPT